MTDSAQPTHAGDQTASAVPDLSVILVGRDGLASLGPILACLAQQTIAGRIEVIVCLPRPELPPPQAGAAFAALRTVITGPIDNRGAAAAHGMRAASAPIVAQTENHCFPDPDWAEKLLAAHRAATGGTVWAGVAPAISNANPETSLSWAIYGAGYARFAATVPGGEMDEMPLHNTSFARNAYAPFDNELDSLMMDERQLQARIRAAGGRFLFHPAARSQHVNEATWTLVLRLAWANGRRFGGTRQVGWGWPKRLAYAAAFPALAIPVMRDSLGRLAPVLPVRYRAGRFRLIMGLTVALTSLAHTLGEAVGYLRGPKHRYPFVDSEEFMILERLGGRAPGDPRIAAFVALARPLGGTHVRTRPPTAPPPRSDAT